MGLVFLAGAAIGGGLKAAGHEIPVLRSRGAQVGLALVGCLALLLGLLGERLFDPSPPRATATPPSSPSGSTPPDTSASAQPSEQPWPGEPDGVEYKTGTATPNYSSLGADGSIDLDNGESEYGSSSRSDLVAGTAGVGANHGAQIALWPQPEPPTLQDCRRLPSAKYGKTELIETERFQSTTRYCTKSKEGRFGRIQTISTEVTSTETRYNLSYVLWKKPGDK
jgi:hypothetical protein